MVNGAATCAAVRAVAGLLLWTAWRERDELIAANAENLRMLLSGQSAARGAGKDEEDSSP